MKDNLILDVRDLHTTFSSGGKEFNAVDGVSLQVKRGETLAIVGESGSGKSVTSLSVMRLIPNPPGRISGGEILFRSREGEIEDLVKTPQTKMRRIRGGEIAMIFQEPMTSLNPLFRVGRQISEAIQLHRNVDGRTALEEAVNMLRMVDIPAPEDRVNDYPHQMSGGMRQRVMIAMALSCRPSLVIADEPTTALDVTIQAQILDLMRTLQEEIGMSIMFITHNLGVVAEMAERVLVMYAGRIVEQGSVNAVFEAPRHPYTKGLMACIPGSDVRIRGHAAPNRLYSIPGAMPNPGSLPSGCVFASRCPIAASECGMREPALKEVEPDHFSRCLYWKDV